MKTGAIFIVVLGFLCFGPALVQGAPDLSPVLPSHGGNATDPASTGSNLLHVQLVTTDPPASLTDEDKIEIVRQKRERDIGLSQSEGSHKTPELPRSASTTAGSCTIVSTIESPCDNNVGLAWDGEHLWVSQGDLGSLCPSGILEIDSGGNELFSFSSPGSGPRGLAYDSNPLFLPYLWSADFYDNKIYRVTESGDIVGSIPVPSEGTSGLAWDGNSLWVSEWYSYKIYKVNPANGEVLGSFDAPDSGNEYPYGLAWDGQYLWGGSWIGRTIMKISVSGSSQCTYSISQTSQSFGSSGGSGSVGVWE